MGESTFWSVDQLAARSLFASLNLDATDDMLEQAADYFARHRESAYAWSAERVHSNVIRKLEAASMLYFARESDEWTDGFCAAEQQVMAIRPSDLLETETVKPRTQGQILRTMVRQARSL
ncbi:hypothetical protein BH10PSE12_BH10PSE12_11470 [soil metagenome]